jgi:sortase A
MAGRHLRPARPRRGRGAAVAQALVGTLAFVAGAAIFLHPMLSEVSAQCEARAAVTSAMEAGGWSASGESDGALVKRDKGAEPAYQWLLAYNARVATGEGGAINDPWGIGSNEEELAQVGLPDALVGTLYVPVLGEDLPVYLGSSTDHLSRGVAVVSGTSAPLGQTGSNVLIAGHRSGTSGLRIFRDIEDLAVGDTLVLETPWDTLGYRMVETLIIDPTDATAVDEVCAVQPGRDLVTLMTCHPYPTTRQRYVAVFERDDTVVSEAVGPDAGTVEALLARNPVSEALSPSDSPQLALERWVRLAGLAIMLLAVAWGAIGTVRAVVRRVRRGSRGDE